MAREAPAHGVSMLRHVVMRVRERLVRLVRESPGLAPSLFVLCVAAVWSAKDGGYDPRHWLAGALFVLAVLVVYALTAPGGLGSARPVRVALVALALFTAWSYLSIAWAGVEGDAWLGANRTLLYLCVFAVFVLRPWAAPGAMVVLVAFALSVAVISVWEVFAAVAAADPAELLRDGRLALPIVYYNASAALFGMAAWPAVFAASRREVHPLVRGACLAAAGALVELALLCQSRASVVAFAVTLVLYLAIVPGRVRSALALVPVAATAGLAAPRLADVYSASQTGEDLLPALGQARSAIVWTIAVLAVLGAAVALVDRSVAVPRRTVFAVGAALLAGAAVGLLVVGAVGLHRYGDPRDRAERWWDSFRTPNLVDVQPEDSRFFGGLGGGRYEVWRVAVHEIREHPLTGIGSENFAVEYLRERRVVIEEPRYPHSLELGVQLQTGLVGSALFCLFLGSAVWGAARSLARGRPFERAVAGAALTTFAFWAFYGSVDWFWEMPALGAPALALLGMSMRVGEPQPLRPPGRRVARVAAGAAAGLAAVAAAASLALPWLSARQMHAAVTSWQADPAAAFDRLDRARRLNPISDEPDVYAGVIAAQIGDEARQRAAFLRAHGRNPLNWYPLLSLGAVDARAGRREQALAWLAQAERLNPLEETIRVVREGLLRGRPVSDAEIERILEERVDAPAGSSGS